MGLGWGIIVSKDRIKCGVTGSVSARVRDRVSINIILFVLHFIHLYSVDGATVLSTDP